ncbi:hypothetical protein H6S82_31890 [Planktothrix sp. FACHB-1355]|uniref:Uncharacterized protein n=1 Tax=Aerosakkonema funiforme FACHB-1375 TaxID=2949571 RepID=A0A926ZFQ4_9CYAN|nr:MULTISPECIES: hypothetical protein [Oscillatoriales]MBD2181373.1 hypothetical protein [Aerosakkonema funiforme FACHB-1375]MBD3563407.1 hypothetical protein [Planktothrix sp. FACHB-1355]
MEPLYFKDGNYIYECKSSPENKDGPLNNNSLRSWTRDAKNLLNRHRPSGFRYVFPVNRVDSSNEAVLEKLKENCPSVDIQYYDCDSVDRLIRALEKVNSLPELVAYIKQARK